MLRLILLILTLHVTSLSYGQSAQELLKLAYDKCQSVEHGSYLMEREMKFMSGPDTMSGVYECVFRKTEGDTLFPVHFHYKVFVEDTLAGQAMYNGDALVWMSERDHSATVTTTAKWATYIDDISHNYEFYTPLTSKKSSPLLASEESPGYTMSIIETTNFLDIPVHHVRAVNYPESTEDEMIEILREQYDYWISSADHMPLQYEVTLELVMGPDTMFQFERQKLLTYNVNRDLDTALFELANIPGHYTVQDHVPHKRPELLAHGSEAPDWTFLTLAGDDLHLHAERGNIVLLDFFYKSCYPCLRALPALQSLHEKYSDQGLRVIGVDPYDKPEDNIAQFMENRGVTYPVVLTDTSVPEAYNVSGYPTIYLIDKEGRIIHSLVGYGDGVEEKLEEIIRKELFLEPILDKADENIRKE